MSRLALIIPVHNRRETTLGCLRHLRAIGDLDQFSVILVDDGSTDGTADAVRAEFHEVEVMHGDGNLWWTGAIALGMKHAFAASADAVCWLNDDCLPAPGALRLLLDHAMLPPGHVVAPACFDGKSKVEVPNAFVGRECLSANVDEKRPADGLSGYCVAVPCAVWARLGAPDAKRFPHYYGDSAYTLLATRAGFPVLLLGAARADLVGPHATVKLRDMRDPTQTWWESWRRTFISPKSPYRLRTLFAFQRLKYGALKGTATALGRSCDWIWQFLVRKVG